MKEDAPPPRVAGFTGDMVTALRRSALSHPRQVVEVSLKAWDDVVLPGLRRELDGSAEAERDRIRAELRRECGGKVGGFRVGEPCRLNKGHIGGCSTFEGVVTVSIERVMEILNG